ncbi:unnamed protein product [Paramecium pentaurelia]|uniref:Uncharacterized protein n=1 Tax=Paramecium pentaurelia TaxID=43138 RepID=A0A8S1SEZ6_9CILI|nr:unnamed protein product [Paramecium pentaurelia]
MQSENNKMQILDLKSSKFIRSNTNKITNLTYLQRLEIQRKQLINEPINCNKTQNNNILYPYLIEKVENQIQRNLLTTKSTMRDTHSKVKTSYLISKFRLRLSKSIEKYMNKQEDQTLIKIQSYQEMDPQLLTPRQLMLQARTQSRKEKYSVFYRKIKRVQSDHEDQYTTQTNTINNNNSYNRPFSYYFSKQTNQIK